LQCFITGPFCFAAILPVLNKWMAVLGGRAFLGKIELTEVQSVECRQDAPLVPIAEELAAYLKEVTLE